MKKILFEKIVSNPALFFLLRVWTGIVFMAHGAQKLFGVFGGWGYSKTLEGFLRLGIPPIFGHIGMFTEFFAGLFLFFGFLTRIASLGLMIMMLVAVILVHLPNGFYNPKGFEFPLTLFIVNLVIFLGNAGWFSIDNLILKQ